MRRITLQFDLTDVQWAALAYAVGDDEDAIREDLESFLQEHIGAMEDDFAETGGDEQAVGRGGSLAGPTEIGQRVRITDLGLPGRTVGRVPGEGWVVRIENLREHPDLYSQLTGEPDVLRGDEDLTLIEEDA